MSAEQDLYLIALARQMRSGDIVHVGASQFDVWQAAEVARGLWAPDLRLFAGCGFHLKPSIGRGGGLSLHRTYARDLIAARHAVFMQSRDFDDLRRTRVSFAGGMQVDERGNANLIAIMAGGKIVRGPGSAGLPSLTSHAERFFIAVPRHNKRTLVSKVDRISVLGDRRVREAVGLPPCSLQEVITPLASFRQGWDGLEVIATSPGVGRDDLQRNTGFDIRMHPDCTERAPLTVAEQEALALVRTAAKA
jgi:glutaconate CoA-transferase subunit B